MTSDNEGIRFGGIGDGASIMHVLMHISEMHDHVSVCLHVAIILHQYIITCYFIPEIFTH